jgi:hypothetical protein
MKKFNMQNVFVWVLPPDKGGYKWRYTKDQERIFNYLRLQVHNSLDLGWAPEDIIPITNFPFEHMGVKSHELDMNICWWSSFANRMRAVNEMIKKGVINDNFWVHDLDAYQLEPFEFPKECKGVSFTKHAPGRVKPQGASVFYTKESFDIVDAMATTMRAFKAAKEESFFPLLLRESGKKRIKKCIKERDNAFKELESFEKSKKNDEKVHERLELRYSILKNRAELAEKYFGQFSDRFGWVGWEYNLCHQRMFDRKYKKAAKPIKVVHCKLEYQNVIDCFYGGKNSYNARVVTDRVGDLFFKYNLLKESQRRDP